MKKLSQKKPAKQAVPPDAVVVCIEHKKVFLPGTMPLAVPASKDRRQFYSSN